MNIFFKKSNYVPSRLFIILMVLTSICMFLWFTSIQEDEIQTFYLKWTYFDKKMKDKSRKGLEEEEFDSEESRQNYLKRDERESKLLLKNFQSLKSENQNFFLEVENKNQHLNQELVDEFNELDYKEYNSGKIRVNNYLIKHHLKLKSLNYSTDSAIFTMNVLEFVNTPLFFLCFFLLMPINYFKKYEDGRIKLLLTQPLSRRTIIWEDYKIFSKNSLSIVGIISISSLFLSFIASREMSMDYPIQLTLLGKTQIIPIYQYLIMQLISFVFISTFIFFFTYLGLLLCRKTIITLFLTFFICLSWNTFIINSSTSLNGLNPFSYVDIEKVGKSIKHNNDVKYVVQTERHIGNYDSDLFMGNVVENPYYYANNSLAKKNNMIDVTLLPIILASFSLFLFVINSYLLSNYKA